MKPLQQYLLLSVLHNLMYLGELNCMVFWGGRLLCQPDQDVLVCLRMCFSPSYSLFFKPYIVSTFLGFVCSDEHEILFVVLGRITDYFSKPVLKPFMLSSQLLWSPVVYGLKVHKHTWCWFILFNPKSSSWRKRLLPWGFSWKIITTSNQNSPDYKSI